MDAITVIFFIGSVFSPYYARRRRAGGTPAANHVAVNVALYPAASGKRWAMTERSRNSLLTTPSRLQIGASTLSVKDQDLTLDLDEVCVPWLGRVRGRMRLKPRFATDFAYELAPGHLWHPAYPLADIELDLDRPDWRWEGHGYADHNAGDAPLEQGFSNWNWAQQRETDGVRIAYETWGPSGHRLLSIKIDEQGRAADAPVDGRRTLPATGWRIAREIRDSGARVLRTLEDTPFYARTLLESERGPMIHESLDLTRFRRPWVQSLLPFRMPRINRG